jgi:4-amino-4-deoxy-L-arabinose transferase-like glycosyltransferase
MCQLGVESGLMSKTNRWPVGLLLLALTLLAAWLRWPGFFANTLHADEALFASWARLIAVWRDPLLQSQAIDKPPLLFYSQAVFFPLFGLVDWAARLPNLVAGLLLVPLTGRLAWTLYRQPVVALVATAIVALSPLAVQFSPTAFTDPLLASLVLTALVIAVSGRRYGRSAFWAGLFFGLAAATKYQAWLFLPLLLALAGRYQWPRAAWTRFLAGLIPVLLLLLIWEVARSGRPALWSNQLTSFGGLRLVWSWELWPRLLAWGRQWGFAMAQPLASLLLALVPPFWLWTTRRPATVDEGSAADRILLLFGLVYVLVHWLLAVPVWDRYLLPVLPFAALLVGRMVAWLPVSLQALGGWPMPFRDGYLSWGLGLVLLLAMVGPAVQARRGELPVGGQPEADGGAAEVAAWLAGAPYGTVLYDHWHSWHWGYYFFDRAVYVSWFPHPAALVEDLTVFGDRPETRYLVLPDQPEGKVVARTLTAAGIDLQLALPAGDSGGGPAMKLYRLLVRPPSESIREEG